jgi:hypothetical protein
METTVFWDMTALVWQIFTEVSIVYPGEEACSSELSLGVYQITQCNVSILHRRSFDNLKSHKTYIITRIYNIFAFSFKFLPKLVP